MSTKIRFKTVTQQNGTQTVRAVIATADVPQRLSNRFARIRYLLAAFDRGEFTESGLANRLARYIDVSDRDPSYSRKATELGLPAVLWVTQ